MKKLITFTLASVLLVGGLSLTNQSTDNSETASGFRVTEPWSVINNTDVASGFRVTEPWNVINSSDVASGFRVTEPWNVINSNLNA